MEVVILLFDNNVLRVYLFDLLFNLLIKLLIVSYFTFLLAAIKKYDRLFANFRFDSKLCVVFLFFFLYHDRVISLMTDKIVPVLVTNSNGKNK